MGSGYLGMESLPSMGFPLSGVYCPQQPTHTPSSLGGQETLSFLDRQGLTSTHFQQGYRMGWFAEVQALGCSALISSCYPGGLLRGGGLRNHGRISLVSGMELCFAGRFLQGPSPPSLLGLSPSGGGQGLTRNVEKGW